MVEDVEIDWRSEDEIQDRKYKTPQWKFVRCLRSTEAPWSFESSSISQNFNDIDVVMKSLSKTGR